MAAVVSPSPSFAQDLRFRVTLDPAGVMRADTPVSVRLEVGEHLSAQDAQRLGDYPVVGLDVGADGPSAVQAQVLRAADGSPEAVALYWVVKSFQPGQPQTYGLTLGPAPAGAPPQKDVFRFADGEGVRDLFYGDQPVYRHVNVYDPARHDETYKPFHHVYGFHGDGFITKGPGGKYTHHRGLFVAWNQTRAGGKSYDFWHCKDAAQLHRGYAGGAESVGPVVARAVSLTDWADAEGKAVVRDARDVSAWQLGSGQLLLDFVITLTSAGGDVELRGDPQHAGFQFRAAEEVQDGKATYIRPATAKNTGNDVWEICPWAAALFKIKGRPYAVQHMDAPENPRPAVYSTRDYGRFGAFFTADLKPGAPLRLRYRVLILDAEKHADVSADRFDTKYRDFATPLKVSAERVNP